MKRQAMALERWMIRGRGDEGITMCGKKNHVNKGAETGRAGRAGRRLEPKEEKKTPDCQSVTEEATKAGRETGGGQLRDD